MLSFEQIKELIELVSDHRLQGIEVERSGFRLTITGKEAQAATTISAGSSVPAVAVPPAAAVEPAAAAPAPLPAQAAEPAVDETAHVLESPIVGTFYASPAPDAEPFVRLGDRVKKGQVLCIVEAMKLMNEIEADADGEIVKIYPKNAQPVEYGEPLFAIQSS